MSMTGPPFHAASVLADVRHGFFCRHGGVSSGVYASLNAGTGSNDDAVAVAENRRRIAASLGAAELVGLHQAHTADAVFVTAPWPGERPTADALVTTMPGLALCVLTADCAPVLLADVGAGVIGAAHAGWKGALAGVLDCTVALMRAHGARPERIAVAIGPCIHQSSYEVGAEFEARFRAKDPTFARFFAPGRGDKLQFDLPGFCANRLAALGLVRVETLPLDTYPDADAFYSNRRAVHLGEADYGRNGSAITLG